jgi:histidyl-tRNA synthetase
MKAQMKAAGRAARIAAIVGADEAAGGTVTVRPLRGDGTQIVVERDQLVTYVRKLLSE